MMETTTTRIKLETRMQKLVDSFSIPLRVVWSPDEKALCHGEIAKGCITIYDINEEEAWDTFLHELIEYRLNKATRAYREMTNALIGTIEKLAYTEKESFIESIPVLIKAVENAKCARRSRTPQTNPY